MFEHLRPVMCAAAIAFLPSRSHSLLFSILFPIPNKAHTLPFLHIVELLQKYPWMCCSSIMYVNSGVAFFLTTICKLPPPPPGDLLTELPLNVESHFGRGLFMPSAHRVLPKPQLVQTYSVLKKNATRLALQGMFSHDA